MTHGEFFSVMDRIRFQCETGERAPHLRLYVAPHHGEFVLICLEANVPNVENGRENWVCRRESVLPVEMRGESDVIEMVRRTWAKLYEHEFAEWARLDGKRIMEPHP